MNKDLDAYFTSFEHTAIKLECPKNKWTVVPSTVLTGKAQVAYGNIWTDKYAYEKVKVDIFKSYKLVPGAYRQQFCNYMKNDNHSWVNFQTNKKWLFEKWINSRKVINTHE